MELIFLLSVIFMFDTCSAAVKAMFGCPFDSNYNLLVPATGSDMADHVAPVWGEMGIASFVNYEQFRLFSYRLNTIYQNLLPQNPYNTIDNLLTFYKDYKNFGLRSNSSDYLNDFFIQYKETDKPMDGASLTIQIVNKMIARYPHFTTQTLAFSLSTCMSGDFGTLTEDQLRVEPHLLPWKHYNDLVMGVLRFKIRNNEMGTIILDPAHGVRESINMFDSDNYARRTLGLTSDPMEVFNYLHMYKKKGDYVLVNYKIKNRKQRMCYIGKSFCSYENASRKPALVMSSHSMVAYNELFTVTGGLFLDLYETDIKYGRIALWGHIKSGGPMVLKFKDNKQLNKQLKKNEQRKKVDEVGKAFKKTPEQMDELFEKIGIMVADRDFILQMKELYDWFRQGAAKLESG